jgi:hypothetical protein
MRRRGNLLYTHLLFRHMQPSRTTISQDTFMYYADAIFRTIIYVYSSRDSNTKLEEMPPAAGFRGDSMFAIFASVTALSGYRITESRPFGTVWGCTAESYLDYRAWMLLDSAFPPLPSLTIGLTRQFPRCIEAQDSHRDRPNFQDARHVE